MMWQQFLAVLLVLSLLSAALWLLRRQGLGGLVSVLSRQPARPRQMQVLERVALGGRHSLHLIALGDRLLLVGVSPAGCRRIAAFSPRPAASPVLAGEQQ